MSQTSSQLSKKCTDHKSLQLCFKQHRLSIADAHAPDWLTAAAAACCSTLSTRTHSSPTYRAAKTHSTGCQHRLGPVHDHHRDCCVCYACSAQLQRQLWMMLLHSHAICGTCQHTLQSSLALVPAPLIRAYSCSTQTACHVSVGNAALAAQPLASTATGGTIAAGATMHVPDPILCDVNRANKSV